MTVKQILSLYLLVLLFLDESGQEFISSFHQDDNGATRLKYPESAIVEIRAKRSPCIIGTRYRIKRCHRKGKRSVKSAIKTPRVSFQDHSFVKYRWKKAAFRSFFD